MRPLLCLWFAALGGATLLRAQEFRSGVDRTSLIELYTSEGCSSCPPAERWLGGLEDASGLWTEFVPVEFHVNYWDRLGWPDRFASKEATAREYAYAAAWNTGSVYTPCFVRDGAEWHPSREVTPRRREPAGVLTLRVQPDGRCVAGYVPARPAAGPWEIHVALLGHGLRSRVTAGENRGETLAHHFVVLAQAAHKLDNAAGEGGATFSLPAAPDASAPRRAVAAWVTHAGELEPLQATGGWLPAAARP